MSWIDTVGCNKHEIGYSGVWRQVTGLSSTASPAIRNDAGDSFKSSLTHTWTHDRRDYPLLPSSGYLMKTVSEIAGYGPLAGDVGFLKSEAETQAAIPLGSSGITFTAGLRGGLLYLLAIGGQKTAKQSKINDRFQLGGPNDVRGFRLGGLGPHDGTDALGGDIYAAGGASLLFPLPRVGKDTPLRLQAFVNGGRLLALAGSRGASGEKGGSDKDKEAKFQDLQKTIQKLGSGIPSCAAGLGLVYAHPVARFEVNFSVPLVMRTDERARKGVSFGVGVEFL